MKGVSQRTVGHSQASQIITALEKRGMTPAMGNRITEEDPIPEAILDLLNDRSPFENEEAIAGAEYGRHFKIRSVEDQQEMLLAGEFQYLKPGNVMDRVKEIALPAGAEMMLVVPKPSRIGIVRNYPQKIENLVDCVKRSRDPSYVEPEFIHNHYEGIRQVTKTALLINRMESFFVGDFMAFPVQLGRRYAGCSARRTRIKLDRFEFGLPSYVVCCALMTHIERLASPGEYIGKYGSSRILHVGCPGDEFKPYKENSYAFRLAFRMLDDEVDFCCGEDWKELLLDMYGPATGFYINLK